MSFFRTFYWSTTLTNTVAMKKQVQLWGKPQCQLELLYQKSSSCHGASPDFPNSHSPFVSLTHRSQQVPCLYRAVVDKFLLVGQHLHVSVKGSIGKCRLWVCLLLQQCPACLVCLIWMVLEMEGRCPYSCCFMGCCFQDYHDSRFWAKSGWRLNIKKHKRDYCMPSFFEVETSCLS